MRRLKINICIAPWRLKTQRRLEEIKIKARYSRPTCNNCSLCTIIIVHTAVTQGCPRWSAIKLLLCCCGTVTVECRPAGTWSRFGGVWEGRRCRQHTSATFMTVTSRRDLSIVVNSFTFRAVWRGHYTSVSDRFSDVMKLFLHSASVKLEHYWWNLLSTVDIG